MAGGFFSCGGDHLAKKSELVRARARLGLFKDVLIVEDENLDAERLSATIDRLAGLFDPKLLTLYLHCFNLQVPGGWPELTERLSSDERLKLT
jgi:hypothetical protein